MLGKPSVSMSLISRVQNGIIKCGFRSKTVEIIKSPYFPMESMESFHASAECSLPKICKSNFFYISGFRGKIENEFKYVDEMVILAATVCFRYPVEFFEFTLFKFL
jgi:hypothetical protein